MKYMMLDCESDGLQGETFAVGYCVFTPNGIIQVEGMKWVDSVLTDQWCRDNIPKDSNFSLHDQLATYGELRNWFVQKFRKHSPVTLVCDHVYPVESNFLSKCAKEHSMIFYPVIDMHGFTHTIEHNSGLDPINDRLENELPAHNPLNDCRQSVRIFCHYMARLRKSNVI